MRSTFSPLWNAVKSGNSTCFPTLSQKTEVKYELRITNYELRITNYEVRITNYEVRITNYEVKSKK